MSRGGINTKLSLAGLTLLALGMTGYALGNALDSGAGEMSVVWWFVAGISGAASLAMLWAYVRLRRSDAPVD